MQWVSISEKGKFGFAAELEPVFGVLGVLLGDKGQELCAQVYGETQVESWKGSYRFLFEAFQTVKGRNPWGMVDFLLDLPIEELTLESYRDHILALPAEEVLWRLLEPRHPLQSEEEAKALLRQALTEDGALDQVYEWVAKDVPSFLGFSAFVRQIRRFVRDFFGLAMQLRTEQLHQILEGQEAQIRQLQEAVTVGVGQSGELAFSEVQLGKTFRNRGPYEEFLFLPSYLMPMQACRFFHLDGTSDQVRHSRQILFLSLRQPRRLQEDTLRTLKAVADGTRYQILILLAQKGPLRGLDIAREISIAASTVSHHMDQLKEGGLITEEQVKNSKYYGLNRRNSAAFLEELQKDLGLFQ